MSKSAFISGASRGIGRACAIELAHHGYDLFITCEKNSDLLEETAEEIRSLNRNVYTFTGDLSNERICTTELFPYIDSLNRTFDLVINNAGISYVGLLQDMTMEQWNQIFAVNMGTVFSVCKFFIPKMLKKGSGRIINISSVWGNTGASTEVAYSATKGAINSFTKALAKELAPSNIQVNAVSFGIIDTDMNNHLSLSEKEAICEEVPAGRMGTTKEAGEMIYKIATSPAYMTGQVITMDGGWC